MREAWIGRLFAGKHARCASVLLVCLLFTVSLSQCAPGPGLDLLGINSVHSKREGLDPYGNPIDMLISKFGSLCIPELRAYEGGKPCRVESELSAFVDSLPYNRQQMTDTLIALGATCDGHSKKRIDCVYSKRERITMWLAGDAKPPTIVDDIFVFRITIERRDGASEPHVVFTRTEEVIKEEK